LTFEINDIKIVSWTQQMVVFVQLGTTSTLRLFLYPGYILNISESYTPYFLENDRAIFTLTPSIEGTLEVTQNVTIYGVKSGIVLKKIEPLIEIKVTAEQHNITINLDDYFTGYRKFVDLYYPNYNPNRIIEDDLVRNDDLAKFKSRFDGGQRFEFASIQDDHHTQKSLIYLGKNTYLYID
jgi:hypothetical protein